MMLRKKSLLLNAILANLSEQCCTGWLLIFAVQMPKDVKPRTPIDPILKTSGKEEQ